MINLIKKQGAKSTQMGGEMDLFLKRYKLRNNIKDAGLTIYSYNIIYPNLN